MTLIPPTLWTGETIQKTAWTTENVTKTVLWSQEDVRIYYNLVTEASDNITTEAGDFIIVTI